MFCSNCGTSVDASFCRACGSPASLVAGKAAAPRRAGWRTTSRVTGIIFLVVAPYNRTPAVRFHAFQSILFHVAWVGLFFVEIVLGVALPFALSMVVHAVGLLAACAGLALWVYLMWKAYGNQAVALPLIGSIARKQSLR